MKFLISLNNRIFSKYDSDKLIENIIKLDVNKVVGGAEIYIDMTNETEKEYCLSLTKAMKYNNKIVQIHSISMYKLEENTINQCLEYYNKISLIYGGKIKLTMHPAEEISKKDSIIKTIEKIEYITEYIQKNNLNLEVLIENLNEHSGIIRCNIYEVYEIMDNLKIDGITLDMGHYVYDYSNNYTSLDKYIDKIKNIHVHDVDNGRNDHHPFYYGNVKVEEMAEYIKKIKYNENVVLEIGLEYLNGETFKDKMSEYIKQIEYVSKYCI